MVNTYSIKYRGAIFAGEGRVLKLQTMDINYVSIWEKILGVPN